jgi:hypothetical protein
MNPWKKRQRPKRPEWHLWTEAEWIAWLKKPKRSKGDRAKIEFLHHRKTNPFLEPPHEEDSH